MAARLYQRIKSTMQSGRAKVGEWTLEYEPAHAKTPDPLTGWAGSGDTREQLRQEPVQFLQHMIRNNLPVRNLIESEFIVANEAVAR